MLRLAEEIGGAQFCIDGFIRNHHRLSWSCKQINANPSEQLPLCFRNKGIAGANNHVTGLDGLSPQRH